MSWLVYCLVESSSSLVVPQPGVGGASIEAVSTAGLSCLVSPFDAADPVGRASVRDAALDFHRTLKHILRQVALVPFRFPTLMESQTEISNFLHQREAEYANALSRLRTVVQMEILVSSRSPSSAPASKSSGAEYLRLRKAEHDAMQSEVSRLQSGLEGLVAGWRCRETGKGTRCYALVDRLQLEAFAKQAAGMQLSSRCDARLTGPWPATEFLDLT